MVQGTCGDENNLLWLPQFHWSFSEDLGIISDFNSLLSGTRKFFGTYSANLDLFPFLGFNPSLFGFGFLPLGLSLWVLFLVSIFTSQVYIQPEFIS